MKKIISLILMIAMLMGISALAEEGITINCPFHLKSGVVCKECNWKGSSSYQITSTCSKCEGTGVEKCFFCQGSGVETSYVGTKVKKKSLYILRWEKGRYLFCL